MSLCCLDGADGFTQLRVEDDPAGAPRASTDVDERRTIGEGESVVIPPGLVHHVDVIGPVAFRIEFHRSTEG